MRREGGERDEDGERGWEMRREGGKRRGWEVREEGVGDEEGGEGER